MKLKKHKAGYITRPKFPKHKKINHRRIIRYCERCRIKDGLGQSSIAYGVCSYCGWEGRVYVASFYRWNRPIINDPKHIINGWYWRRGPAIWSRNRKDK